jgi:hypothetical protein
MNHSLQAKDQNVPKDIICFGTDWYSPSQVSIRQIVDEFHERGSRVLWINPIPVRFPSAKKADFWNKVQYKAKTHAKFLSKKENGFYVYSPIYIPVYRGPGFILNRVIISLQVLLVRLVLGFRKPLVLGSTYTAWFGMPAIRKLPFVFHFADKISSFREVADRPDRRQILEKMESEIVAASTLSTCSSVSIYEHVLTLSGGDKSKVRYLPHAVKGNAFFAPDGDSLKFSKPDDIADLPQPIAGYFGSLTATNDQETFIYAAETMKNWNFVFIGRVSGDYSRLKELPNVYFLGPRVHQQIPSYGSSFDVCFMGWKDHEWIKNCFPLKTLEYLALEKPIVCSCHIDEISTRFPQFVKNSTSREEFAELLERELESDSDAKRVARHDAVIQETWSSRIDEILRDLEAQGANYEA